MNVEKRDWSPFFLSDLVKSNQQWEAVEGMGENNNEIIIHIKSRKNYNRKNSIKSYKESIAEKPLIFT